MSTILIVEDDVNINEMLKVALQKEGYSCIQAFSGTEGRLVLSQEEPDLVLLDLMLPGMSGETLLEEIRQTKRAVPVIVLSARDEMDSKVDMLLSGADDYVAKPFGMMELLSRIRALLRRTETENGTLRCGILEVDPGQHIVRVRGQETVLTQKEFEVLCLLLRNPGQVLSREQLIENVWGYAFTGESRTVDVHVRTLRQKLGEAGAYIETVRGYGYKISPVN